MNKKKGDNVMVKPNVKNILPAMAATCLTQADIARSAGVGVGTVYRIKAGYLVRMDGLGKVCKFLGVPMKDAIVMED